MVLGCLNYKHIRVFSLRPKIKLEEFIKFFGRIHTILSNQSFFFTTGVCEKPMFSSSVSV